MLEQLFGSKTRAKLLQLFFNDSQKSYYLRQLARELKGQLNSVRREVNNLEKLGLIVVSGEKKKSKKYFKVNTEFILYPELKALLLKARLLLEKNFVNQIEKCAKVHFLVLTGFFVGLQDYPTDMVLVGKVNKKKLAKLIKKFERQLNHDINYTVMTLAEFKYRQDITDRFLYSILEGKKAIIIDKISL
jgi:hypothetical protein